MRQRRWLRVLAATALFAATAAMNGAIAQGPRPAPPAPGLLPGQQQGSDQPIQIDAKSLEVHDRKKQATFTGSVKVVQGDTTMTCNTLVVFYGQELGIGDKPVVKTKTQTRTETSSGGPPDAQSIRRIEAHGDVTVLSKDQSASGDLGVYDVLAKTITLTGNVVVTQGKNVIHGGRVVVNTVTGNAHVEPAPGVPDGRVRALIIPSKDNKGGQGNFVTIGPGPGSGQSR